jgi:hypothetical protein
MKKENNMTLVELLTSLRNIETKLRSAEVQAFFGNQTQTIRDRFISFRQEVSFLVGKLTNAQLAAIAAKLNELSDDLNTGISDLQGKIDALNNAVAILNTLGTLLGLAARIAALAA